MPFPSSSLHLLAPTVMQPPSSESWPAASTSQQSQPPLPPSQHQPRRPPPQPEFQCHHSDCLRRFVRKTSLTNHLKAHQNLRSRSIYRTKRARLRAAAARQAAAAAASAASTSAAATALSEIDPTATSNYALDAAALPIPEQRITSHLQDHRLHLPRPHNHASSGSASAPLPAPQQQLSRRTDSSPISAVSAPSSPAARQPSAVLVPSTHSQNVHESAPTSLVSPNSFSTYPLDVSASESALMFSKAFDLPVAATPTWGVPQAHPQDPSAPVAFNPAMLPFVHPPRHLDDPVSHLKPDHYQSQSQTEQAVPIVSQAEAGPTVGTTAAASDLLPQADIFSEPIETLHPYEFLGDFGSYQ